MLLDFFDESYNSKAVSMAKVVYFLLFKNCSFTFIALLAIKKALATSEETLTYSLCDAENF